ncbi:MAG: DNA primase, partial [Phycisphaerae bacterium]|nr:DNA primase [Phycisphaerae bacterium]
MARFSERFVNQVQQATDIVDVVGQYVALKKRGKEFVGLCPFHDDNRPSMYVSPAKQIYKCFA